MKVAIFNINSVLFSVLLSFCASSCVQFVSEKYRNEAAVKRGDYFYEFTYTHKQPKAESDLYYYYFENQKINKTRGYVGKNPLDGELRASNYDSRQIVKVGEFRKGLKHGQWNYYSKDGILEDIEYWRKGELQGAEVPNHSELNDSSKVRFPKLKNVFQRLFKKDSTSMQ